jgi:hypothetical protein
LKTRETVAPASVDVESKTRQHSTWPRARSPRAGSPKPEEPSPTFDGIECDGSLGDAVSDYPMSDGGGDTSADHPGDTAVASIPETVLEQLGSFTAHGKLRRQSARLASRGSAPSERRSPPMKRATVGHAVLHGPPNPRSTSDFLSGFMPWLGSKGLRGCEEPNEHASPLHPPVIVVVVGAVVGVVVVGTAVIVVVIVVDYCATPSEATVRRQHQRI